MKSLLKIFLSISFLSLFIFQLNSAPYYRSGSGLTIGGTPPTTSVGGLVDAELQNQFEDAIDKAFDKLLKYSNQPELAKGFANANAYAAQAGTHQGYQDYELFAVTTGVMVGAQLPSSDKDYYDDLDKKIKDKGDIYAGVAMSLAIFNVGINAGFIYPGLFLNAKFGYFSNSSLVDNLSVKSTLVGVGANYSWIHTKSFLAGFFKWRGISFGTGFLYNYNKIDYKIELDRIDEPVALGVGGYDVNVSLDPSFLIGVKSSSYSIPFDVTTSIRLLWFLNFNLGAGIDFNFGTTDIKLKADGNVTANVSGGPVTVVPGSYTVDAGTKDKKPSWIRERITTGIGFNISVVKIDVPVIIYPFDNAFAIGLTAGVVW